MHTCKHSQHNIISHTHTHTHTPSYMHTHLLHTYTYTHITLIHLHTYTPTHTWSYSTYSIVSLSSLWQSKPLTGCLRRRKKARWTDLFDGVRLVGRILWFAKYGAHCELSLTWGEFFVSKIMHTLSRFTNGKVFKLQLLIVPEIAKSHLTLLLFL